MEIFNPFSEVYSQIVSLVTPILVPNVIKVGNFIEFTDAKNLKRNAQPPAGYPALYLFKTSGFDEMFDTAPTFEQEDQNFDPSAEESTWDEAIVMTFRFLIIGQDQRLSDVDQVLAGFLMGLRSKGPRLGLPYAKLQKAVFTCDLTDRFEQCFQVKRQTIDGNFTVQCPFRGSAGQLN